VKQTLVVFLALISFSYSISNTYSQTPGTSAQTDSRSGLNKSDDTPAGKGVSADIVKSDMAEALSVIEDNYVGGKSLNYNDLFKTSIDSMLHTLDPHSNYFDSKEFEQFKTEQSSQ
jgi:C-terminal processing protease CtpA/Prc